MAWTKEQEKIYKHEYYLKNKDRLLKNQKARKLADPEKGKQYSHEYYLANKKKILEYAKKWALEHPENRKKSRNKWTHAHPEYHKKWWIEHRDEQIEYARAWWAAHPEKKKETTHKWAHANSESTNAKWRRRHACKLNAPGNGITADQAIALKAETGGRCVYCGQKKKLTIDHVVPLIGGGADDIDNAVPACTSCNSSKGTKSLIMFLYSRS